MTTDLPATTVAADGEFTERCQSSGDYLAGLIADGILDTVGRPTKLPELMWPHVDPELVRTIWQAGVAAGYAAGQTAGRPRWTRERLNKARTALQAAGYEGMARLVGRTNTLHPQPHPAELDTPRSHP
ncbi:hypothetical protein ACWGH4_00135 [Streptomyces sp. NPDC054847]